MFGSYLDVWRDWKKINGRMRRDRFWEAFAGNVFVIVLLAMVSYRCGINWVYGIYYIASLVPFFSACSRRLHDSDKSRWWLLLSLIPFVGWIVLVVMLCWASNPEANKYGPNPYEAGYYHL